MPGRQTCNRACSIMHLHDTGRSLQDVRHAAERLQYNALIYCGKSIKLHTKVQGSCYDTFLQCRSLSVTAQVQYWQAYCGSVLQPVTQAYDSAHLHIGLETLDGGLSRAQSVLSLVVPCLHIVLPL